MRGVGEGRGARARDGGEEPNVGGTNIHVDAGEIDCFGVFFVVFAQRKWKHEYDTEQING